MKNRLLTIGGVILVGLVALVVVVAWPRGADPVSEDDALSSFREQDGDESSREDTSPGEIVTDAGTKTPAPGVYKFTGSGSETVQLGPIPAETRVLPAEISGVVVGADELDDQACFEVTLNLIEQHTENSTYCRTPGGGLRLEHYEKHQTVSAFSPTVDIRCDPGVLWEPGTAEQPLACSLRLLGGPKEVSVDLSGTATTTEGGTLALASVAGSVPTDREVVAVKLHFDVEGSITGTWDETLRFTNDDALLVGIKRHFDLKGFASFLEDFDYEITSGIPAT